MKKSILFFFVMLAGALCFSSCQKPEGDDVNDLFLGNDASSMFRWEMLPNVDYADVEVTVSFKKDTVAIVDLVKICYCLESDPKVKKELNLIEKETTIIGSKPLVMKARIEGLEPDTTYKYCVCLKDFFGEHQSDTCVMRTKKTNNGHARVTTDSIQIVKQEDNEELWFYGSVRTHYKALQRSKIELKFRYGDYKTVLDNELTSFTIDRMSDTINDTVTCEYHCTMPNEIDSCWYRASVKDAWGNNLESVETLFFNKIQE